MNFSVVIPTYNRRNDLEKLLKYILKQHIFPKEIIIVDDGDLGNIFISKIENILRNKGVKIIYYKKDHRKEPRGAGFSRNIGMDIAKKDIVFILDDDLVLEDNFFGYIMNIWGENKSDRLLGVGGVTKNSRKNTIFEKFYYYLFGMSSKHSWDITEVGFQVWDEFIKEEEKGYYVIGGVCAYNKKLARNLTFKALSTGQTYLEDVDFCLRAKKKGLHFIIEPKAKVIHNLSKIARDKSYFSAFKASHNRKIIFQNEIKKTTLNYVWFYWSCFGWSLRQLLTGHFVKFLGEMVGYLIPLKNKII